MDRGGRIGGGGDRPQGISISRIPLRRETVLSRFPVGSMVTARIARTLGNNSYLANFQGLNLVAESSIPFRQGQLIFGEVLQNEPKVHIRWMESPSGDRNDQVIRNFLNKSAFPSNPESIRFIKLLLQKNLPIEFPLLKQLFQFIRENPVFLPEQMVSLYSLLLNNPDAGPLLKHLHRFLVTKDRRKLKGDSRGEGLAGAMKTLVETRDLVFMFKLMESMSNDSELRSFILGNRLAAAMDQNIPLFLPFFDTNGELRFIEVHYREGSREEPGNKQENSSSKLTIVIPFENLGETGLTFLKDKEDYLLRVSYRGNSPLARRKELRDEIRSSLLGVPGLSEVVLLESPDSDSLSDSIKKDSMDSGLDVWI